MKKVLLTMMLPLCLLIGQDQPELPGWGVYVGYAMVGASGDSVDVSGAELETVGAPGFGVSKGVMLGGFPLQVGVGLHPRGYKLEVDMDGAHSHVEVKAQYLDLWAQMPYPVGPVFASAGFNVGTHIGGTSEMEAEFYGVTVSEEVDLEAGDYGLDVGLNFGLGMPLGETGAQVGVVYLMSLNEPNDGLKWNGLFFNVGYSF